MTRDFKFWLGDKIYIVYADCNSENRLELPFCESLVIKSLRVEECNICYLHSGSYSDLICREDEVDSYNSLTHTLGIVLAFSSHEKVLNFCNKVNCGKVTFDHNMTKIFIED